MKMLDRQFAVQKAPSPAEREAYVNRQKRRTELLGLLSVLLLKINGDEAEYAELLESNRSDLEISRSN